MNNPLAAPNALPFTREQFEQMRQMLNVTIPAQEDNLNRAQKAGLDVTQLKADLAKHKATLQGIVGAWDDKYK